MRQGFQSWDKNKENLVFVYGSLKKGFPLHSAISDSIFIGNAKTQAQYQLYDAGSYPAILNEAPGTAIIGEVYFVEQDILKELDRIEGVPNLYRRAKIKLENHKEAWGYLWADTSDEGMAVLTKIGNVWNG